MTSPFAAGQRVLAENFTNLLNPPRCRTRQIVAQTIPNSSFTAITFTAEEYDTNNGHSTSVNTSRYVVQVAGLYRLEGKVCWDSSATGQRASDWRLNGSTLNGSQVSYPAVAAVIRQFPAASIDVQLGVADFIELFAFQDAGGTLNTNVANAGVQSYLQVTWIGTGV